ncbi:permease [Terasakiella sp. A23]|uniref:permease n=1 Tax=Terasakiella sp. FCG-A23 TaxID=3080561 RepID=UPI0029547067|nr:permease [Terasakiella sp. A23]MDV7340630.1 permease [Terasakiella sp. A23]
MTAALLKIRMELFRIDKVWMTVLLGFAVLYGLAPQQVVPSFEFTLNALIGIAPFILASVIFAAYASASGLDGQVARVFSGSPWRSIMLAALFGALSPFCSCGVVPIIAGLLAAGVPLAPVMAFWLASPLMDPEMFVLMVGVLGIELTVMKTLCALIIGMTGGGVTHLLMKRGLFADPLKAQANAGCGCSAKNALKADKIVWKFWTDKERLQKWNKNFSSTGLFLVKWLTLAFFIESLMVTYIPADEVGVWLGNGSWFSVPMAVLVGIPAYLNGYAAIPTVSGLIELGMSPAAGLGFMVGGGVTSIPAAMAVYAVVKRSVFSLYLVLGVGGAMLGSMAYLAYLTL